MLSTPRFPVPCLQRPPRCLS